MPAEIRLGGSIEADIRLGGSIEADNKRFKNVLRLNYVPLENSGDRTRHY